jgi:hypothetical protein
MELTASISPTSEDACIICLSNKDEQILLPIVHTEIQNLSVTRKMCKYLICAECQIECDCTFGKGYCPLCRNKKKLKYRNENINNNQHTASVVQNGGLLDDIFTNNLVIKSFSPNQPTVDMFTNMTTFEFIKYCIFSFWFGCYIVFPLLSVHILQQ